MCIRDRSIEAAVREHCDGMYLSHDAAKGVIETYGMERVSMVCLLYTSSTVRRYLAQRAELLGAIRLPNDAFKKNAGAEVVSDIIFLQKRDRQMCIRDRDYTLYDAASMKELDGGQLDMPELSCMKAVLQICDDNDLSSNSVKYAPLPMHKAGTGNQCTCQQRHGTGFKGIAGRFSAFPAF